MLESEPGTKGETLKYYIINCRTQTEARLFGCATMQFFMCDMSFISSFAIHRVILRGIWILDCMCGVCVCTFHGVWHWNWCYFLYACLMLDLICPYVQICTCIHYTSTISSTCASNVRGSSNGDIPASQYDIFALDIRFIQWYSFIHYERTIMKILGLCEALMAIRNGIKNAQEIPFQCQVIPEILS